jgi:hypothetical protein
VVHNVYNSFPVIAISVSGTMQMTQIVTNLIKFDAHFRALPMENNLTPTITLVTGALRNFDARGRPGAATSFDPLLPFIDLRLGVCGWVGHARLDQPSCSKMQVRGL